MLEITQDRQNYHSARSQIQCLNLRVISTRQHRAVAALLVPLYPRMQPLDPVGGAATGSLGRLQYLQYILLMSGLPSL